VNLLYPRVIVNALAVLSAAAGAAMLVPAAYSLLTAPNDAWVFWLPGAGALALGVALFPLTRRPPRSYVSRQTIFFMVVVGWLGVAFIGSVPFFLSGLSWARWMPSSTPWPASRPPGPRRLHQSSSRPPCCSGAV